MWNHNKILLSAVFLICALSLNCNAWSFNTWKKPTVCVIGAGPAGLTSAKQLADDADKFNIIVFEKNQDVGGIWNYEERTGYDEHNLPIRSPVYKNLRTNGPKELMAFPDYLTFNGDKSCVTHETVLSYLKNYTEHFNLRQYIKFNTVVEEVVPYQGLYDWRTTYYVIKSRNLNTNHISRTICDAVMICNGYQSQPNIPEIPGIENFHGKVIHSIDYRVPEEFANKTVILLGALASGIDIALEVSEFAKKVYLSHNKDKIMSPFPSNVEQVSGVLKAEGNTLILRDGTNVTADAFMFCTGYSFSMPFMTKDTGVNIERKSVSPLHKQLLNVNYPTMSFIGLPKNSAAFPALYVQAKYFAALLKGKVILPHEQKIQQDATFEDMSKPYPDTLNSQWNYLNSLAEIGGFEPLPQFYKNGYNKWIIHMFTNFRHFRDYNVIVIDNKDVKIVPANLTSSN